MLQGSRVLLGILLATLSFPSWSLEPEDILGEYWKDPLFGVASAQSVHRVEVLYKLLFPKEMEVFTEQKTRFVFENNTDEVHVFLFSSEPSEALEDSDYAAFVRDEVMHAKMEVTTPEGHEHTGSSTDDAKSMVGSLADRPTMTIQPHDTREMIIKFDEPLTLVLRCVLDGHEDLGHESIIKVLDGSFFVEEAK